LAFAKAIGEYSQRFEDVALDQRLCVSFVVGFDYFEMQLSAVMDKYLKFYNDPKKYEFKRQRSKRFQNFGNDKFAVNFQTRKSGKVVSHGDNIVLEYPT
jgi:hypothetical protein